VAGLAVEAGNESHPAGIMLVRGVVEAGGLRVLRKIWHEDPRSGSATTRN